jgi:uncharacterized protein (TIGR00369 family)
MPEPAMTAQELETKLVEAFPEVFQSASRVHIEALWHGRCRVRLPFRREFLRPGGTVSGPTMMRLTDVAMYVAVLSAIGWVPLAVTTQLNIHFLRKPEPRDLLAEAKLLRLGKRSAVGEVTIRSDGTEEPVAHATSTYSIPLLR